MNKKGLLVAVLLTVFAVHLAGSSSAETLTLKEAVSIALENNRMLKAFSWSVESRREEYRSATGHLYPKITLEEKFTRTNNPTYGFMAKLNQERFNEEDFLIRSLNDPRDISDFQTSINIEQPLFVPRLFHGLKMAGREVSARDTEFEMMKSEIVRSVIRNSLAIQAAREYTKVSQLAFRDAQEHKRLASLRYETGTGLYSDMLRADARIKSAEAMITRAESDLEIAMRSLGLLLGKNEPVDIADEKILLPMDDLSMYLDAAVQRQDVQALRLRYANVLQAVGMEKSVFWPEVGIGGSYLLNDHRDPFSPEGESYIVRAFLRWNLFDSASYHRIRKAEAEAHEMKNHLSGLEQEIEFRVKESFIRIREKEKTLELANAAREDAAEALRLVRTRYENGLAPLIDLLDTQLMLDTARAKAVEAENEYISAVADLYYQSGMLLKLFAVDGH